MHVTIEKINQMFPLSAADVNYTNGDEVTKTVEARLREIDYFDPTEVLKNISDITENVKDIAKSIEHVTEIAGTAIGVATVANGAATAVAVLEANLWKEIPAAAAVAGDAVVSIGLLGKYC
jgi:hypothetical protein